MQGPGKMMSPEAKAGESEVRGGLGVKGKPGSDAREKRKDICCRGPYLTSSQGLPPASPPFLGSSLRDGPCLQWVRVPGMRTWETRILWPELGGMGAGSLTPLVKSYLATGGTKLTGLWSQSHE